jgi:hypothetical protein
MSGGQKGIYDEARAFLQNQDANFSYVEGDAASQLRQLLDDPYCYQGQKMQQAKTLLDGLRQAVDGRVRQEKTITLTKLAERWQRLIGMAEFDELTAVQQSELEQPVTALKQRIEQQTLIAVIRDLLRRFDETEYPGLLRRMVALATPPEPGENPPSVKETVTLRSLYVPFNRPWLADEADVAHYLQALEKALLAEIEKGKQIQV